MMNLPVLAWAAMVMTVIHLSFQLVCCSYLGYPRLNFAGQFRADVCTCNNNPCDYFPENPKYNRWGTNGTDEFQFLNSHITSVVYNSGQESVSDELVGHNIIGNLHKPFAKITDLDVACMDESTIYGMNFGIGGWDNSSPALYGKWTPSVIGKDCWHRIKCYDELHSGSKIFQESFHLGCQGTTFITDIQWDNGGNSLALQQLQHAVGIYGKLSVHVTLFYFIHNNPDFTIFNSTLGYVIGTIGVASQKDTLNFGGQRILNSTSNVPEGMSFPKNDLCFGQDLLKYQPWMSKAPFEIDTTLKVINVDFSNALPVNLYNTLHDVGTLRLGILINIGSTPCVKLIGDDVPYLSEGFLTTSGGIYTTSLSTIDIILLFYSKLVVTQLIPWAVSSEKKFTPICRHNFYMADWYMANILLEEIPYFVRPWNYYLDRLEYGGQPSIQTLYVTYFGQPAPYVQIKLLQSENVIPQNGIQPDSWIKPTDQNGMVTFEFRVATKIPYPRQYSKPQCSPFNVTTLPIDGQVYQFVYCVDTDPLCTNYKNVKVSALSFLAYSTVSYTRPYAWQEDVRPILSSYAMTAPVMKTILDLGSYEDLTLSHNIHLLNISLRIEFEDPGFMPTTRDLSPTKRAMILEWLTNPIFTKTEPNAPLRAGTGGHPPLINLCIASDFLPSRCKSNSFYDDEPEKGDYYFSSLFAPLKPYSFAIGRKVLHNRPLFGLNKLKDVTATFASISYYRTQIQCSKESLQQQLQTAVQLEFATIPPYTTSLYSIVDGCNLEIYQRIRSILIQEMLHMTQVANILIAIGGTPLIDDASTVPSYPTSLPGNVLPGLVVSLKKLSLRHIYEVFLGIEIPKKTVIDGYLDNRHLYTIGAFYDEIVECMDFLDKRGINIYDPDTVPSQVQWPWDATSEVGTVYTIKDHDSAVNAIREVITQGEGAGLVNPYDIANDSLAHFFKFEEVVCQKTIVDNDGSYSYSGDSIPFNPCGVWPMRDNPSKEGISPNTSCYVESRVFHKTYRLLLHLLQETFSGSPEKMLLTIEVMESLQIHAKRLMWTRYQPHNKNDSRTCGPIWDYDWP